MRFNLLIQKDDPLAIFSLPPCLVSDLQMAAKKSRRKLATEIIIRLARTFDFEQDYQLLEPLVRLDYLKKQEYTLPTFKVFKAENLHKGIDNQLKSLKQYFQQKEGFIQLEHIFPKELWKTLQLTALRNGQSVEEGLAIRLISTLEEPELFNLPENTAANSCKGSSK